MTDKSNWQLFSGPPQYNLPCWAGMSLHFQQEHQSTSISFWLWMETVVRNLVDHTQEKYLDGSSL